MWLYSVLSRPLMINYSSGCCLWTWRRFSTHSSTLSCTTRKVFASVELLYQYIYAGRKAEDQRSLCSGENRHLWNATSGESPECISPLDSTVSCVTAESGNPTTKLYSHSGWCSSEIDSQLAKWLEKRCTCWIEQDMLWKSSYWLFEEPRCLHCSSTGIRFFVLHRSIPKSCDFFCLQLLIAPLQASKRHLRTWN